MPLPNPALKIHFQFDAGGTNTLTYHHDGESGFCDRKARYSFQSNTLTQEVIWVNPDNADWCSQDTDMQMGRVSFTPAWIEQGQLHLKFQMGEEEIIYVWDHQPSTP